MVNGYQVNRKNRVQVIRTVGYQGKIIEDRGRAKQIQNANFQMFMS